MEVFLVSLLVLLAAAPFAGANTRDAAYSSIPERNVFGLKTPAAKPADQPQPTNEPKVFLTGITTILGTKQALLVITPPNPKPGDKPESVMLAEGQREGPVQVVRIDEKQGAVHLLNSGNSMTITFDTPPPTSAATNAPAVASATGAPGLSRGITVIPRLPGGTNANPLAGFRSFPLRTSQSLTNYNPIPTAAPGSAQAEAASQLTPEERAALLQIEEQVRAQEQPAVPPPAGTSQQYVYPQSPVPPPPTRPYQPPLLPQVTR